jgi:hypothetical protein
MDKIISNLLEGDKNVEDINLTDKNMASKILDEIKQSGLIVNETNIKNIYIEQFSPAERKNISLKDIKNILLI